MNIIPSSLPEQRRPEVNRKVKTEDVILPDGRYVRRVTYDTGNHRDTIIFPGDAINPKRVKA